MPLRLSLIVPGAVSSGPYECGAIAALILASQTLGEATVVIDSVTTASARSITGLLTARSLLGAVDPIELFEFAWSRERAEPAVAADVLRRSGLPSGPVLARQKEPVRLSMAFANIGGLTSKLSAPVPRGEAATSALLDWYSVEMTNAATPRDFLALADALIAPGSHVEPLDNGPLSRAIDLAEDIGSDDERLYLLIDPGTTMAELGRGNCSTTPLLSVPEDLLRLERTRAHVEWVEDAAASLHDGAVAWNSDAPPPGQLHHDLTAAVGADITPLLSDRQCDPSSVARRILTEREADRSADYAALLDEMIRSVGGPERKGGYAANGLAPPVEPADVWMRPDEFALGYRAATSWLEHRLRHYLPRVGLAAAWDRVDHEYGRISTVEMAELGY